MKPQIIAFDLDNTFLDSDKRVPKENLEALEEAHRAGAHIVPSTGRFPGGLPEEIERIPFIRYAITINGAVVYDLREKKTLSKTSLPLAQALEVMRYLDGKDVVYDCYIENGAYMSQALRDKAHLYIASAYYRARILDLRTPVPELKAFITENGTDVSKIQMFAKDMDLRAHIYEELGTWPFLSVTTSLPDNIEITHIDAHKGAALEQMAKLLDVPMERTFAIGDGLNDVTMLQCAGRGVAMGNAEEAVKAAADEVTGDCDHGGFADAVNRAMEG